MRQRVKKQIKDQEDMVNKLRWDIQQNNILITFLQSRLEEAQHRIQEREQDLVKQAESHVKQVD
jgi:chromosome segregation ATPase